MIEAVQYDGENEMAIINWSGGRVSGWFDREYFLQVRSSHGDLRAVPGDWIIQDARGEWDVRSPDAFEASYEAH